MAAIQRGASQHHPMRMERRRRDRRRTSLLEEARVRLQGVEESAVEVEDIDVMPFGAPIHPCD